MINFTLMIEVICIYIANWLEPRCFQLETHTMCNCTCYVTFVGPSLCM